MYALEFPLDCHDFSRARVCLCKWFERQCQKAYFQHWGRIVIVCSAEHRFHIFLLIVIFKLFCCIVLGVE